MVTIRLFIEYPVVALAVFGFYTHMEPPASSVSSRS